MNYEEFKKEITDNILAHLSEGYKDCEVKINEVYKNNERLDGLTILSPDVNICPTIYLNSLYQEYQSGKSMDEIMDHIASIREDHEVGTEFKVSDIKDFNLAKSKIGMRIYGLERNEDLLANRPHAVIGNDLAITYTIELGENSLGKASVPITNSISEMWGKTARDLHEIALDNQSTLTPSTFKGMTEVMSEMMGMSVDELEEMGLAADDEKMFVLSNEQKMYGASALLDEKMMDSIIERVGSDFSILPSSIHEVLIIPSSAGMSLDELEAMVQDVNATQVDLQDQLSDHVYKYDGQTHELFRADMELQHDIYKDVRACGFIPNEKIMKGMESIAEIKGMRISLKDVSKMAHEAPTGVDRLDAAINDVANECKAQELAKINQVAI